jgi:DNA-binding transcriptional ArsR family regulator
LRDVAHDDRDVVCRDTKRLEAFDDLPATTTTLAKGLPVTRQAVAKHLAVLNRVGLVAGRRRGREVRYAVRPVRLDDAAEALARVAAQWDRRLARIKRLAESVQPTVAYYRAAPATRGCYATSRDLEQVRDGVL